MKPQANKFFYLTILTVFSASATGCCTLFPNMPWCLDERNGENPITEVQFTSPSFSRLCPTHIGGDREFNGHGPDVTATVSIAIRNSNTEIWATIYLHAKETRSDWTEAEGQWNKKLWTAPSGKKIVDITSDTYSETSYVDTDHDLDRPPVRGGNLVRQFEIMGDTGGNDVGNCTSDDVYINVRFNDIHARVQDI